MEVLEAVSFPLQFEFILTIFLSSYLSNSPFGCKNSAPEFGIGIGDVQFFCLDGAGICCWNSPSIPIVMYTLPSGLTKFRPPSLDFGLNSSTSHHPAHVRPLTGSLSLNRGTKQVQKPEPTEKRPEKRPEASVTVTGALPAPPTRRACLAYGRHLVFLDPVRSGAAPPARLLLPHPLLQQPRSSPYLARSTAGGPPAATSLAMRRSCLDPACFSSFSPKSRLISCSVAS